MKSLALFEGYLDDFSVTVDDLISRGFPNKGKPEFYALVAEADSDLIGILVYYFIPFTYDLRPTLFIKELFVEPSMRNQNVGEGLFKAIHAIALEADCGRIKWDVLDQNMAAKRFYQRQGARSDSKWQGFVIELV